MSDVNLCVCNKYSLPSHLPMHFVDCESSMSNSYDYEYHSSQVKLRDSRTKSDNFPWQKLSESQSRPKNFSCPPLRQSCPSENEGSISLWSSREMSSADRSRPRSHNRPNENNINLRRFGSLRLGVKSSCQNHDNNSSCNSSLSPSCAPSKSLETLLVSEFAILL